MAPPLNEVDGEHLVDALEDLVDLVEHLVSPVDHLGLERLSGLGSPGMLLQRNLLAFQRNPSSRWRILPMKEAYPEPIEGAPK